MATAIALRTMPIGNHMTNAEEIMAVPYKGVKKNGVRWGIEPHAPGSITRPKQN